MIESSQLTNSTVTRFYSLHVLDYTVILLNRQQLLPCKNISKRKPTANITNEDKK